MRHSFRSAVLWIAVAMFGLHVPTSARAQTAAEFFTGKTVRILIAFDVAGTYGQYAQLAAQHLRQHLPGNPNVIVQVMQGAGGIVALNHVASIAPKDGTIAILVPINIVQDGLLNPAARYDPRGFEWLGRMMELIQLAVANEKSGVASLDDARARTVSAGGSGATNPTSMSWHVLNLMAGTRFNVVSGYKGLPDAQLAWERAEVDTVMMNWETAATERFAEPIKAGRIKVLWAYAARPLPELAGIPLLSDFSRTPEEKAFLSVYTVGSTLGRSFALAKGVPADRVAAWRTAFDKMLADPQIRTYLAERGMRFDPLDGAGVAALVARSMDHTPETMAGIRAIYDKLLATAQ